VKILVTTFPAFGHFHPVAPLALAAQRADHEVRVASGGDLVTWIQQCGLSAHPVGMPLPELIAKAESDYPGEDSVVQMFTRIWVSAALPDLLRLTDDWRPDLIIHEEEEYAALLLAAMHGIPCVTHSWNAPVRPRDSREVAAKLLDAVWAEAHVSTPVRMTGNLYLDACPEPFQTEDITAIPGVIGVRPVLFDGPFLKPPSWLAQLQRPAAYVTLGTVPVFSTPELLGTIVAAVSPLVASVLVTTGPNPVLSLGDLPTSVHAEQYLPQSLILPHVDLVVSHGGAGGTVGALLYALPHLALPLGGQSQITAAEKVQSLGIGLQIAPANQSLDAIRAAARQLLSEESFHQHAEQLRGKLDKRPTPNEVIRLLAERFAQ